MTGKLAISVDGVRGVAREVLAIHDALLESKTSLAGVPTGGNAGFRAQRELDGLLAELSSNLDQRASDLSGMSQQLVSTADAVQTNEDNGAHRAKVTGARIV